MTDVGALVTRAAATTLEAEPVVRRAAQVLGVSERTLTRWMREDSERGRELRAAQWRGERARLEARRP